MIEGNMTSLIQVPIVNFSPIFMNTYINSENVFILMRYDPHTYNT